jgi:hypothetical protein
MQHPSIDLLEYNLQKHSIVPIEQCDQLVETLKRSTRISKSVSPALSFQPIDRRLFIRLARPDARIHFTACPAIVLGERFRELFAKFLIL